MKLLEIGAPADICPDCIQLKMFLKRLIRRGELKDIEFEYIDAMKDMERAMDIIFKHGAWLFNPESPKEPHWYVPQLFLIIDGKIYFLHGKIGYDPEEEKDVILSRIKRLKEASDEEKEKLALGWLREDLCDADVETEVFGEGTILPVLRPDLCRDVLAKIKDERIRKHATIVAKMFNLDVSF